MTSAGALRLGALFVPGAHLHGRLDLTDIGPLAARAEVLGLHRVAVSDHLSFHTPTFEPVVGLAAMASTTHSVRLATEVLVLPLRHPVHVAQAFTSLDRLSGGRVELGIGVGGEWPEEFDAIGVDSHRRGRLADDHLAVILDLWGAGIPVPTTAARSSSNGSGREDGGPPRARSAGLAPGPVQVPHPPLVIGGRSEAALARAARVGQRWDGIFFDPARYASKVHRLRELADRAGREVGSGLVAWLSVGPRADAESRLAAAMEAFYRLSYDRFRASAVCGPVEACAERLSELAEAGAEDVTLILTGDPAEQVEALGEVAGRLQDRRAPAPEPIRR